MAALALCPITYSVSAYMSRMGLGVGWYFCRYVVGCVVGEGGFG